MQAIILAGGEGRRLRPYTTILPKPLMPIGDRPILSIILEQLKKSEFNDITIATGYLGELIQAYFKNGKKNELNIKYSFEDKPLGTVGPIALIDNLEEDFLAMNGDILTDANYKDIFDYHKKQGVIFTIGMIKKHVPITLGVIKSTEDNFIKDFIEKPNAAYNVSMGIYIFNKKILNYIKKGEYLDIPTLIHKLLKDNEKVACYPYDGFWLDIGRKEDYEKAQEEFEKIKDKLLK